jgi:hypothetical protein
VTPALALLLAATPPGPATIEQIAPPASSPAGDTSVAQLPPEAKRVRQPEPRAPAAAAGASAVDVGRAYAILSPTTAAPVAGAPRELGPDIIAGVAAATRATPTPQLVAPAPTIVTTGR